MNEPMFRELFEKLEADDDKNFDLYATQFTDSLEKIDINVEPPYWHGRLIGYGDASTPYRINFLGQNLTEKEFRAKIEGKEIYIESFNLVSKPQYSQDPSAPPTALDPHTVTYTATIEASVDGTNVTETVHVTHRIRKTFLAYETDITFA